MIMIGLPRRVRPGGPGDDHRRLRAARHEGKLRRRLGGTGKWRTFNEISHPSCQKCKVVSKK